MLKKIGLRSRIYLTLSFLLLITFTGGIVTVWYTYRIEGLFSQLINRNVAAFQVAEALETALVNQKGYVSYFFLDGDPEWLRQLGEYRQIFKEKVKEARSLVETAQHQRIITAIEDEYSQYIHLKDQVISYYKSGEKKTGATLHKEVRVHFFNTLELCDKYKTLYKESIETIRYKSLSDAEKLRIIAVSAFLCVLCLAVFLIFILVNQILKPLRRLARETKNKTELDQKPNDDVTALKQRFNDLIEDIDYTQTELERSRESLIQSEKLAVVGKLAAGVAHSIRNPLTSVKMRLFSLGRSLKSLSPYQKEDFEVISEEINHLDTIVQNFLEFSRPPKLKIQEISPSDVVDHVLQLLRHRLESHEVDIHLKREGKLPVIQADPEQLKEALVNLMVNACEAMESGGQIIVHEKVDFLASLGRVVSISLTDNGPGISKTIQEKILQPFFTTKEEGTGLGLTIVNRIIINHDGKLILTSDEGKGTTFIITLPIKEPADEHDPDH